MAKKLYAVDIQFTTEFSYHVEARSAEEAEQLALREYESGEDTYANSEVFDAEVTNVEPIDP
jgi:hypothetical protein